MPFREDTDFGVVLVIATTIRTSQWSAGASGSANESTPSARSPRCHSTKPPKIERAAEHEPVFVAGAEADVRLDVEPLERERDAPRRGEIQRRVALAPVLHQGDIHVGASGRVGAGHLAGALF